MVYENAVRLKRYLKATYNICPNSIEGHGHNSYTLVYHLTKTEEIWAGGQALQSIRDTLKETEGINRVTRSWDSGYGLRFNIVIEATVGDELENWGD